MKKLILAGLLVLVVGGCGSDDPATPPPEAWSCPETVLPKSDRLLGMDILNASETGTFEENFAHGLEFGLEFTGLHLLWSDLEAAPGVYTDPGNALALFDTFCKANNIKLSLTIRPIDLTGKTVPADLATTRFNTETMKDRGRALLDFVFTRIDVQLLTSLQIGNEIDGYDTSGEPAEFWSDYGAFLFAMTEHAAAQYPGLKTGFTVTLAGVVDGAHANSGVFEALAGTVDVVGVTYYPLLPDFRVQEPSVVAADFAAMVAKFAGREIFLQEVGYQTSPICGSSEAKQAEFVCRVFQAWDTHRDAIKLVNFVRMNDISTLEAEQLAGPYGLSDAVFIEYLRTLGVRSHAGPGQDKAAFAVLREQANLRGWGN